MIGRLPAVRRGALAVLAALAALSACDEGRPAAATPSRCDDLPSAPERDQATCSNGCDDDRDGDADCADADCARVPPCAPANLCSGPETSESTPELCSNGCSDDGDALVDCAELSCRALMDVCGAFDAGPPRVCGPPLARERGDAACSDFCSNDEDLLVDCADPDCRGFGEPPCGGTAVEDARCTTGADSFAFENTALRCADGCSNDEDQLVDCADPDCAGVGACPAREAGVSASCPGAAIFRYENELPRQGCLDGCSNDLDPLIDCADPDCADEPGC